jgi:uncharacterized lipoprotein YddW (UPF0748 family)
LKYLVLLIFQFIILSLTVAQDIPKREMRAVWIATVENIDWPSADTLPVDVQQKEMIELLDLAQAHNMNTIVFQIRPAADAFYQSSLEPWSQWLTGIQSQAPDPFYDPLDFAIKQCRLRGLDIHVWLNPYRAVRDTSAHSVSPDHITKIHPEWFVTYGKTVYFDPALPQTRDHVSAVVSDIVRRYDIDAVHMDDYFYPYRIAGMKFPDDSSFALFHGAYSIEQIDDWRRHNVDLIIKQLHDSIRSIKPWVQFGISPFGVWRNVTKDPAGSATKAGQTNYDDLFADILKWQKEGWIDYVVPQLYWHIGMKVADYAVLAEWWNRNTYGCPLYIGHALYRLDPKSSVISWRSSMEIIKQIRLNRSLSNINGSMFFSAKYMRTNPLRLRQHITRQVYQTKALPPENSRLVTIYPCSPVNGSLKKINGNILLSWEKGCNSKNFVIYQFRKNQTIDFTNSKQIFMVTSECEVKFRSNAKTKSRRNIYAVTSLSRTNTESEPVFFY